MRRREPALSDEATRWLVALLFLGGAGFVSGTVLSPARAWTSYLVGAFYFLSIALGALVLLAMLHLSRAGWSVALKRVIEGVAAYLPVGAASMVLVLLGLHSIYPWADHAASAHFLHGKAGYLSGSAFALRLGVVLVVWLGFWAVLSRSSSAQDADGNLSHTRRSVSASALFLLTFAYTFSIASVDWLMSVDPHWGSTIFSLYNISGLFVASLATITVTAILLRRSGALPEVNENHLHDLGKLLFGGATFWAYLWFSQYLLIWYANIPEETVYYVARAEGGWDFLFYLNFGLNWVLPFFLLLPRPAKRSEDHLLRVSAILLIGRWLDLYLMVAPTGQPEHRGVGFLEVAAFVAFASLFVLVVARSLRAKPLIARGDPYLVESLHHHQ